MASNYQLPPDGESPAILIDVVSAQPRADEIPGLVDIPFARKPVSSHEVVDALKWFAAGAAGAVACFFFGRWVIGRFIGPGVLIFGYGAVFIGTPVSAFFSLFSLSKLFRSARKKKPLDALRWIFQVSYLGEDAVSARFGSPDYAVATLDRILPAARAPQYNEMADYVMRLREVLAQEMDRTTAALRDDGWGESSPNKLLTVHEERELFPGVREMHATMKIDDIVTRSDSKGHTINMIAARLELQIRFVLVRSGKYWYPYDVCPNIAVREVQSGAQQQPEALPVNT